jgi:ATP-dependent RNA helicase SUPV3L1/SUV3
VAELLASLHVLPSQRCFTRLVSASDTDVLERMERDADVKRRACGEANVRLLWQACQIPDYRQGLPELHAELVKDIFLQLTGARAALDEDWLAASVHPLDDTAGDIDALTARIAAVRTWTYLSNHSAWVPNVRHWVERTRDLEDRLSDALHERLIDRFVEHRRHSVELPAAPAERTRTPSGSDDSPFSALRALREQMEGKPPGTSLERWIEDLVAAPHERFRLDADGRVFDAERPLGYLARGATLLRPEFKLTCEGLSSGQRLRLSRRMLAWARDLVQEVVGVLRELGDGDWSAAGRGLVYQLEQNLGSLPTRGASQQISALTGADRDLLRSLGVKHHRDLTYAMSSLGPRQRLVRLALTRAFAPRSSTLLPALLSRVSFAQPAGLDAEWLSRVGFVVLGLRAVRIDVAERVRSELDRRARVGAFELPRELAQWLGCGGREVPDLIQPFGYRRGDDGLFRASPRRRRRMKHRQKTST